MADSQSDPVFLHELTVNKAGRLNASPRLVSQASKIILACMLMSIAVVPLFVPQEEWVTNFTPMVAFTSVYILAWRLAERGRPVAGAHVFLWGTYSGQVGVLYMTANLSDQALVSGVNLVLSAGFMFGRKAATIGGVIYTVTLMAFRLGWWFDWLTPGALMASEGMRLVALLSTIMGTMGLTFIGLKNMTGAIISARAHAERAEVAAESLRVAREAEARRATRAERLGAMARSLVSLRKTDSVCQEVTVSLREALDARIVIAVGLGGRVLSIAGLGRAEPPVELDGLDLLRVIGQGEVVVLEPAEVESVLGQLNIERFDAGVVVARGPHTSIGLIMVAPLEGFDPDRLSWSVQVAANLMDAAVMRIESEHRMVQAQKMDALSRLSAGIAHDFNNLLTTILGGTEILHHTTDAADPIQSRLRNIREAGERAAALTSKLMTFTRSLPRQSRRVDVSVLLADLLPVLRRTVEETIDIEIADSDEPVWIQVDPLDIERVVLNLVANARDAIGSNGRIDLGAENRTSPDGRPMGVVWVQDNGEGMDMDTRSRVFEPFFTTRQGKGATGLGLSIVYGVIQALQGDVFIDSTKSQGTCVELHLPRCAAADPGAEAEPVQFNVAEGAAVLVVEDDPDVRETICELLTLGGYTPFPVATGQDALDTLNKDAAIRLVLSDVVMPQMGGYDLAEAMTAQGHAVPLALISGYAPGSEDPNAAGLPRITKPFSMTELLGFVAQHIAEEPPLTA
ncbi:MAG: ATP-binding protein [Myxococcota bacterium]|nr:ATP-binding protein [Myxococcota bacterium]